jgi:hypothetical protein
MKKRVGWEVVKMKEKGYTNREVMEELRIKNKSQIKT